MNLTSVEKNGVRVVSIDVERIDAAIAIRFKDEMRNQTDGGPERTVLDLTQVNFIDSSGLGAIVASMKQMGGRRLDLAGLAPAVDKVFRLTRMDTVFNLFATLEDALDLS